MIKHHLAVLKAQILQIYYDLKAFDELPFQLINGDYEDRRVVVPIPKKEPARKKADHHSTKESSQP